MTAARSAPERVVQAGPAAGKITGFNHLVLVCRDMNASVRFYRDILGLRIMRTAPERRGYQKQYFFELGNGELFSLYQMANVVERPEPPVVNSAWPGSDGVPPQNPQKMDHLAFNVDDMETLLWFQQHLRSRGVAVSEVFGQPAGTEFLPGRIYFYDPDGNPLEIATLDAANPGWEGFDHEKWFQDDTPVPALNERDAG